jgi:2-polyprenyl-6-methoxyphenol hydroxylase-like FAD-dependent oxidoreductase
MTRACGDSLSGMSGCESDIVVVGARCAGATTAMLLGRLGYRVTVVERGRIPSDTLSTHGLARGGVVQLAKWGLLDAVLASGAPAIRQVLFRAGDVEEIRTVKPRAGVDHLVAPRRYILDRILADAATAAGATIHTGLTATGVLRGDDGRVHGVRARTTTARPCGCRRRWSSVPTGCGRGWPSCWGRRCASGTRPTAPRSTRTSAACPGPLSSSMSASSRTGGSAMPASSRPTTGQACVWVCCPAARVRGLRGGVAEPFLRLLAQVSPTLAARAGTGQVFLPVRGAMRLPNHVRAATGPGWALVGDAGYHRDPITGHGITDAFRDAELLAGPSTTICAAAPPTCRRTRPHATPRCGRRSISPAR